MSDVANGLHDKRSVAVAPGSSRIRRIAGWILCVPLASVFFVVGLGKVIGRPGAVMEFQLIGLGQWFRYLTGALEILGAAALLIPRVSWMAALLLAGIMVGAIIAHVTRLPIPPTLPVKLLVMTLLTAWLRRP